MSEIRVKSTGTIKLFESDNTSSVTIASPASLGGDRTITIPDADVNLTNIATNTAKTSNATHSGEVTGATALTIADNIVDEANLKVSNAPTNGHFLSAQSGNTGGLTWAAASGGGGITAASMWRLTTSFTGDADPISSNLAVMSGDGYGSLGSAMTVSSGIFTFPSTGYWNIFAKFSFSNTASTEGRYNMGAISTTTDNSTYSNAVEAYDSSFESSDSSTTFGTTASFQFDVTNTTNCKCQFLVAHEDTGTTTTGHGSHAYTHFIFTRLGDT
jgi:hypothetical protein